jgi:hypothetical protein
MLSGKLGKEGGMYLHRVTATWESFVDYLDPKSTFLGTNCNEFKATWSGAVGDNSQVVVAEFPRFGGGKKKSDFQVGVRWEDVQTIIQRFGEAGHPEAIAVREAMKLAAAAKELGWQPPKTTPPHSN